MLFRLCAVALLFAAAVQAGKRAATDTPAARRPAPRRAAHADTRRARSPPAAPASGRPPRSRIVSSVSQLRCPTAEGERVLIDTTVAVDGAQHPIKVYSERARRRSRDPFARAPCASLHSHQRAAAASS